MFPIPETIPRAALVTGGAKRLGAAIALALADAGFDVALSYSGSRAEAETTAATIRGRGRKAETIQADLSRHQAAPELVDAATDALGPLGVLVNNASGFERDSWHDATPAGWDAHLDVNLKTPFFLMQHFARALPQPAEGVVINLLDQRVWSLTPHFTTYTVSKAGLWALTRTMALALAPRIRVCGIGPGPALPSPRQSQAQFDRQAASTPLGRGTDPGEIGRAAIAILALPALTGQMLALDGGQHLQWSPAVAGARLDE